MVVIFKFIILDLCSFFNDIRFKWCWRDINIYSRIGFEGIILLDDVVFCICVVLVGINLVVGFFFIVVLI